MQYLIKVLRVQYVGGEHIPVQRGVLNNALPVCWERTKRAIPFLYAAAENNVIYFVMLYGYFMF